MIIAGALPSPTPPGRRGTLRAAMLTGPEIRARIREGLTSGRLWRLADDRAKLRGATDGEPECHVCSAPISRGQAFRLARGATVVLVHLECYMFWLHACGLLEREPITCAACRRLIPPHAETWVIRGSAYHARCRDRLESAPGTATVTFS
jgi:hypothetical protein